MTVYEIKIGDLYSYKLSDGKLIYGKVIAIFSDGLIFLDKLNDNDAEYDEIYVNDISKIEISNDTLLAIGFKRENNNYVKETINKKSKIIISESNSYVELLDSNKITSIPFTLYSILENNNLTMLQRVVRYITDDDII